MSKLRLQIEEILGELPEHRGVLGVAMEQFGEPFELDALSDAATSDDWQALGRVRMLERAFEVLQNYLFDLASIGLAEARRLHVAAGAAEGAPFERLRDLDVITDESCRALVEMQTLRNRLQHAYSRVAPGELHKNVLAMQSELGDFVSRFERWFSSLEK